MPKYRFPDGELPAREAAALVQDELILDGNARLNLRVRAPRPRRFAQVHGQLYDSAAAVAEGVKGMGPFTLINDGDPGHGIAAVSWRLCDKPSYHGHPVIWNLYDLADRMRTRGWLVPAYSLPPHQEGRTIQRVLIRHGFRRDLAGQLIDDLARNVATLTAHPQTRPLTESETGTSSHTGKPARTPEPLLRTGP